MDTQEIFNRVIDGHDYMGVRGSCFMCNALKLSKDEGRITHKEYTKATEEIYAFIGSSNSTLFSFISRRVLDGNLHTLRKEYEDFCEDVIGLSVYRDWANKEKTLKELRRKYLEIKVDNGY